MTNMGSEQKVNKKAVFPVCCLLLIILNVCGDELAIRTSLPIWFDSFGTMIAGYILGPVAGGMVGFISHILICIKDGSSTWMYALANMMIGVTVAEGRKRGYLEDLFGFCNMAVLLTLISITFSIPDTMLIKGSVMGNRWGNDIIAALRGVGVPEYLSIFFGEFYVDFVDKVTLVYLLYFCIQIYRYIRTREYAAFNWLNIPNLLLLPLVIVETVIRKNFRGEFVDSLYFKNYVILVLFLITCWVSWIVSNVTRRQSLKKQKLEIERLKEKNSMMRSMVLTIAHMVDAKDPYTAKHSFRVTKYSLLIGERLGLSNTELQNLEWAALLHDIGKVAIPDGILSKKGKLSKEEFQVMQSHPVFGYDILKDSDFAQEVSEGVRYHHERYDGSGYPVGLKGEEIPLFGRIIGIADAYDAMSSNRIYRPKCDDAYILSEYRKNRGRQFDPKLCDIFLDMLENGAIGSGEEEQQMTLERAYERFGGRYGVIRRRLKTDERIREFLLEFPEDEEFGKLEKALNEGDDKAAFQAVHTLKGISMNLEFENLAKLCISLTENLRDMPANEQTPGLFEQLKKEYLEICDVIHQLEESEMSQAV